MTGEGQGQWGLVSYRPRKSVDTYRMLVEKYMDLEIRIDTDRLPALSGLTFR